MLRLTHRLGKADWTTEGHGETVIEVHAAHREKLVLDRIRIGVRALYKERQVQPVDGQRDGFDTASTIDPTRAREP